jgi:allantoinase
MTELIGRSVRGRLPYTPIHRRPPLKLPNNARVAVWTIVNVENWSPTGAMPRAVLPPPMGQPLLPDVPNWAWHEYGMRVGFWRFVEALGSRNLKATFALNGSVCEVYPEACEAARDAGWDFMGHGFVQKPMHRVEDQRAAIADTISAIKKFTGKPPRGWESPGLTETDETLDYLAEAGIEYVADWVLDEQPVTLKTSHGDIVSVPYTVEINDVVISAVQQQPSDEIFRRGRDHFDRLYIDGAARDGDFDPSLPDGRAAPDQISGDAVRLHSRPRRRRDVDGRRDFGLVSHASARIGGCLCSTEFK